MDTILLFLGGIGMQELLIIGLFVLIFFGAKKIPEFMKGLGKGVREFKDGVSDAKKNFDEASEKPSKQEEKQTNTDRSNLN